MYPPHFGSASLRDFPPGPDGKPNTEIIVPNKIPEWAWHRFATYDDAPPLQPGDDLGLASWLYAYSSSVRHLFPAGDRQHETAGHWGTGVDEKGDLVLRTVPSIFRVEDVDWVAGVLAAGIWLRDREIKFTKLNFEEASARILAKLGMPVVIQRQFGRGWPY